ncbi:hypothetical protein Rumeso_00612 [Rubellimicrobium mesophilum DSM 19309]|uniref:Uncharacterized protein n=1 Tax=Rubellimicrobium mesophilum DSM 19309 TaxID=442562 RepID=A0A017HU72_9RHOB|nr:hypothetical protein Rumeso_00612 [Rubellimicrobium mesophilum DSM 19309]
MRAAVIVAPRPQGAAPLHPPPKPATHSREQGARGRPAIGRDDHPHLRTNA